MSELWEEDSALRKALPWRALAIGRPQKQLRRVEWGAAGGVGWGRVGCCGWGAAGGVWWGRVGCCGWGAVGGVGWSGVGWSGVEWGGEEWGGVRWGGVDNRCDLFRSMRFSDALWCIAGIFL